MTPKTVEETTDGGLQSASCSPFFYGQKVTHKLNGTAGIITIKGQKYNAGQTWRVRFERADRFEEIEVWEWEIIPENAERIHGGARQSSQSETPTPLDGASC